MLDMYYFGRINYRRRIPPTVYNATSITKRKIQTVEDMKAEALDQLRAQSLQDAVPFTQGFVVTPVIQL